MKSTLRGARFGLASRGITPLTPVANCQSHGQQAQRRNTNTMIVIPTRRPKRQRIEVDFYEPALIPGARSLEGTEWKECARWVVMFGLEFAEAFALKPVRFDLTG